ncbi:hypothetical protein HK407_02g02580 [Ordospora pajunii]|uniref:uncharacterized protein n=1 Tax=Ordospora pajunii TaxID=3039483 RepID=UPI00295283DE|nr:uncharacterized protein HK407_02g02580 [Ordospora pajunii]KAH9412107.1 hypothetical protein HK407_02g02580 [Ordospora pajunii]
MQAGHSCKEIAVLEGVIAEILSRCDDAGDIAKMLVAIKEGIATHIDEMEEYYVKKILFVAEASNKKIDTIQREIDGLEQAYLDLLAKASKMKKGIHALSLMDGMRN